MTAKPTSNWGPQMRPEICNCIFVPGSHPGAIRDSREPFWGWVTPGSQVGVKIWLPAKIYAKVRKMSLLYRKYITFFIYNTFTLPLIYPVLPPGVTFFNFILAIFSIFTIHKPFLATSTYMCKITHFHVCRFTHFSPLFYPFSQKMAPGLPL